MREVVRRGEREADVTQTQTRTRHDPAATSAGSADHQLTQPFYFRSPHTFRCGKQLLSKCLQSLMFDGHGLCAFGHDPDVTCFNVRCADAVSERETFSDDMRCCHSHDRVFS